MTTSSAHLSLGPRPSSIQYFVDQAYNRIASSHISSWYHNGNHEDPYYFCEVDEAGLVRGLIEKAPLGKKIYLLDVGAGNFGWCHYIAGRINEMVQEYNRSDLRFFVYGLRGEKASTAPQEIGVTTIYEWGNSKIENIKEVFLEKEGDLVDRFSLIVTRWTLCHLMDPIRLILDLLDLLEKDGYFLGDGFLFDCQPSGQIIDFLDQTELFLLLLQKTASNPTESLNYILKKTTAEPIPCHLRYGDCYSTGKQFNREALNLLSYTSNSYRHLELQKNTLFYKGNQEFKASIKNCLISKTFPLRPIKLPCLKIYEEIFQLIAQEDSPEKIKELYQNETFDPMSIYSYSMEEDFSVLEALTHYQRWNSLELLIDVAEEIPYSIYPLLSIHNQDPILEKIANRFEKEKAYLQMAIDDIFNRVRYATSELEDFIVEKREDVQSIGTWANNSYYGPIIFPFCHLPLNEKAQFTYKIQKERRKIPELAKQALLNHQYKIYDAIIAYLPKEVQRELEELKKTLKKEEEVF